MNIWAWANLEGKYAIVKTIQLNPGHLFRGGQQRWPAAIDGVEKAFTGHPPSLVWQIPLPAATIGVAETTSGWPPSLVW